MITAEDFPNLAAPIWNKIRIPPRRRAAEIGIEMCLKAGITIAEVRKRPTIRAPYGVVTLRHRIALAMTRAQVPTNEICAWLGHIDISTLGHYLREARKTEERADG